jgi:hypothetical protein
VSQRRPRGTAFHWFDGPAAPAEFQRVLRREGRLALILNRPRQGRRAGAALADADGFHPLERRSFEHVHEQSVTDVVDRVTSISFIATLPADERGRVADALRRIVAGRARGDDGRIETAYRTDVFTTRRR